MRIQRLQVQNFRGFEESEFLFNPHFNVLIGTNGTGKTSVMEAIATALGAWFQGFPEADSRHIRPSDVRRVESESGDRIRTLEQYPVVVTASAELDPELFPATEKSLSVEWARRLNGGRNKTTSAESRELRKIANFAHNRVLDGEKITLPVLRYFGSGRLWESVKSSRRPVVARPRLLSEVIEDEGDEGPDLTDPFYGYRLSLDKRASPNDLIRWMGAERRNEVDLDRRSTALKLVFQAILSMMPELSQVRYELRRATLLLHHKDGRILQFSDLSDGYRNVVAIAADLSIKIAMLNPHLGDGALKQTPGIVLIDELDLHLHPTWQRRVVKDLRSTFPRVQFICTSHSPFIVQSLRSGEELIVLDGQSTLSTENRSLADVARGLMGVEDPDVSERYATMKRTAIDFFEELETSDLSERERFDAFRKKLAEQDTPYADNPAYQAFLETKLLQKHLEESK